MRADTTTVAHSAQEDSVNINKTQSKATLGAKKPRGKVLLLLGRRHFLNVPMIHQGWVKHLNVMRIDIHTRN